MSKVVIRRKIPGLPYQTMYNFFLDVHSFSIPERIFSQNLEVFQMVTLELFCLFCSLFFYLGKLNLYLFYIFGCCYLPFKIKICWTHLSILLTQVLLRSTQALPYCTPNKAALVICLCSYNYKLTVWKWCPAATQ